MRKIIIIWLVKKNDCWIWGVGGWPGGWMNGSLVLYNTESEYHQLALWNLATSAKKST